MILPLIGYLAALPANQYSLTSWEGDLDADGTVERIDFVGSEDSTLRVFRDGRLLWKGAPRRWRPWKMAVADLDGDGSMEILLGVDKATRVFKERGKAIYVLGWNGDFVYAKWCGSRSSRPLLDFQPLAIDGSNATMLACVEEGGGSVALYKWIGFGFTAVWRSSSLAGASLEGPEVLISERRFRIISQKGSYGLMCIEE